MAELFTFTPRGQKRAWLVFNNEDGSEGVPIALLKVSKEEFWDKLGKGLNIKITYTPTPTQSI